MTYIPDPEELSEMKAERLASELRADDTGMDCVDCGQHTPWNDLHPASASPDAPPVCGECLAKIYPQAASPQ